MLLGKLLRRFEAIDLERRDTLTRYKIAKHLDKKKEERKMYNPEEMSMIFNATVADCEKGKYGIAPTEVKPVKRISKDLYYLEIAKAVSLRSTCLRRRYGAVLVKDDRIVSTGYNGAPRGRENCCDTGICKRKALNIPAGQQYELCKSVHAEQNAIIAAGYRYSEGSTLYLAGIEADSGKPIEKPDCCIMCKRVIINAGVSKVIFLNGDGTIRVQNVSEWVNSEE